MMHAFLHTLLELFIEHETSGSRRSKAISVLLGNHDQRCWLRLQHTDHIHAVELLHHGRCL
jgi:hypothetical protein